MPLPAPLVQAGATGERRVLPGLVDALKGERNHGVPTGYLLRQLGIALLPALAFILVALWSHHLATRAAPVDEVAGCPDPKRSITATERPRLASSRAVARPKTPPPTTAASNR